MKDLVLEQTSTKVYSEMVGAAGSVLSENPGSILGENQQMSFRFLQTSDWQLGMTRHFLSEGPQERFNQGRFDAIRKLGRIAREENCQFMLVCGDAFESNQVDRRTVARALEALKRVPVPVYLLPGNHDPLDAASVYRSSTFLDQKPTHVHVIEDTSPIEVADGLQIVGAPWSSKRPTVNPVLELLVQLPPASGPTRICVGHGPVDLFTPHSGTPGVITVPDAEKAITEGKVHFVALGDRHSLTKVGDTGRVWFSGTPESTDFSETHSGFALLVEINEGHVVAREVRTGQWRFTERADIRVDSREDVEVLNKWIDELENKERTIARLHLVGSLTLSLHADLTNLLLRAGDLLGALDVREDDLVVVPDDTDFKDLGFSGFAERTVARLREKISEGGDEGLRARDALMLLLRLARGTV